MAFPNLKFDLIIKMQPKASSQNNPGALKYFPFSNPPHTNVIYKSFSCIFCELRDRNLPMAKCVQSSPTNYCECEGYEKAKLLDFF